MKTLIFFSLVLISCSRKEMKIFVPNSEFRYGSLELFSNGKFQFKLSRPLLGTLGECNEQGSWFKIGNQIVLEPLADDELSVIYRPIVNYIESTEGQDSMKIVFLCKSTSTDSVDSNSIFRPTRINVNGDFFNISNGRFLVIPKSKVKYLQFRTSLGVYPKVKLREGLYDEIIVEYLGMTSFSSRCGMEMVPWKFWLVDQGLMDQDSVLWELKQNR